MTVLSVLKAIGGPGSLGFLLLGCIVTMAVALVAARYRVWAVGALVSLLVLYGVLAIPRVANALASWLPTVPDTGSAHPQQRVRATVLLDGDNRLGRLREAVHLWHELRPGRFVVLGHPWMARELVTRGIPSDRVVHSDEASTTERQLETVNRLLRDTVDGQVVIIASRLQMPRVQALLPARSSAVLRPSPIDDEPPTIGLASWAPSYIALRVSRDALYEHVAIWYYRWNGRLPRPAGDVVSVRAGSGH